MALGILIPDASSSSVAAHPRQRRRVDPFRDGVVGRPVFEVRHLEVIVRGGDVGLRPPLAPPPSSSSTAGPCAGGRPCLGRSSGPSSGRVRAAARYLRRADAPAGPVRPARPALLGTAEDHAANERVETRPGGEGGVGRVEGEHQDPTPADSLLDAEQAARPILRAEFPTAPAFGFKPCQEDRTVRAGMDRRGRSVTVARAASPAGLRRPWEQSHRRRESS